MNEQLPLSSGQAATSASETIQALKQQLEQERQEKEHYKQQYEQHAASSTAAAAATAAAEARANQARAAVARLVTRPMCMPPKKWLSRSKRCYDAASGDVRYVELLLPGVPVPQQEVADEEFVVSELVQELERNGLSREDAVAALVATGGANVAAAVEYHVAHSGEGGAAKARYAFHRFLAVKSTTGLVGVYIS